jgi:hypothetical protein
MHAPTIAEAAQSMIRTHGSRATEQCRHMIEKMARRGDHEGYDNWRAILDAVRALRVRE